MTDSAPLPGPSTLQRADADHTERSSQQLLQAVIDNSTAVVYVKDLSGRYLLVNRRYEEIFRLSRGWIVGKTDYEVFSKENAAAFRAVDEQVLAAGGAVELEEVAPLDDGPHTYISSKCPLYDSEGKVYALCGISTDITERLRGERKQQQQLRQLELSNRDLQQAYDELRRSQQNLLQQERLRALGQMASGVAHDINNAISPVGLYTESLLEREPNLSDRARSYLITIQRAIDDVAQTVGRMREFYRPREPKFTLEPVHLNRIVEQVVELTRVRWSNEPQEKGIVIELVTDLAANLPLVMAADAEIRDALTNLVFNAVDAMPEGGVLMLRTLVTTPHRVDQNDTAREVSLEVSDSGVGMDESTRSQCLEPFFTTKGERGTGLGLAMVYGATQRNNAALVIESSLGKGTTVRLGFAAAPSAAMVVAQAEAKRPLRSLRILMVDDDPLIIESLRDILQCDGHQVTAVDGGQAGIDAFMAAKRNGGFDAVITDLGMPYVDGRRVAMAIKEASPVTPVILLTGWGQRLMADNEVPPHIDRVLNKPPKLDQLRGALFELVEHKMSESSRT
jgi:PAS domain S-box-containing protein